MSSSLWNVTCQHNSQVTKREQAGRTYLPQSTYKSTVHNHKKSFTNIYLLHVRVCLIALHNGYAIDSNSSKHSYICIKPNLNELLGLVQVQQQTQLLPTADCLGLLCFHHLDYKAVQSVLGGRFENNSYQQIFHSHYLCIC